MAFMPGAPAVRSPDALQDDSRTALKELCDRFHASLEYSVQRLLSAPASDPMQWACSLKVPALKQPGSGEEVLEEASFKAVGRGKNDAEQHCAHMALAHIAKEAPQLGIKMP